MDKFVLIDGNSLLNRAFYATPIFSTQDGTPTNGIFGFIKLLFKICDTVKPKYLAVAFDLKAPTFRHKMYDKYKATRNPMPDELAVQVEPLKNLLSEMKVAMYSLEGYEADDVIGTLSNLFDVHSYIYTGDRDSYQLVDCKTDVYFTRRGVSDLLKLTKDNFVDEIGFLPGQIIDLKALMGDSSDNIPGVAGIGEKTAKTLVAEYGCLGNIYDNLDKLTPSVRKKLENGKEMAYFSYELAKINRNVPIEVNLEDCITPVKYSSVVRDIFIDFEFKSLLKPEIFEDDASGSNKYFIEYPKKQENCDYEQIRDVIENCSELALDIGENFAHIYNGDTEYSFKVEDTFFCEGINSTQYIELLRTAFDIKHKVTVYDIKSVMHTLLMFGITPECAFEDLSLAKYLCDTPSSDQNLQAICQENALDYAYSAFCADYLFKNYKQKLIQTDCLRLYEEIEKPLVNVLFEMEVQGVKVSLNAINALSESYNNILAKLTEEIYQECGCEFNINSQTQLGEVLFVKLGLKSGKKAKNKKLSTNAEVLEKLASEHPVVAKILKYRSYKKLISTYLDGFIPYIDKRTSLVHTTYNQTITATGRLSSANPNLQNIPVRESEGREVRKVFIPRDGNVFIDADYSQIELRLLAHFSCCKKLIDAYNDGLDIHRLTASQVFGVPYEDVTAQMRQEAKAVNFGIIYGISDFGLSKNLNIPYAKAKEYIERYFETYSEVKDYMNANVVFARENGYVKTLTGRRRIINEIKSPNANIRSFGERAAMNMPLQGSNADIIKIAMINVAKRLKEEGLKSRLILQVHDELVLDAPACETEKASEILKYEMENAVKLSVSLTVEVHVGKNWYDAK